MTEPLISLKEKLMLTPEHAQFITDEIKAWEQDYNREHNETGSPMCEEIRVLVEDDDALLLRGDDILKQFIKDTGITLEELEEWHEQTKQPDELDIHPDHRQ